MKQISFQNKQILAEKVKEFLVLYDKTDGVYKERHKDADFVENDKFCLIFNVLTQKHQYSFYD